MKKTVKQADPNSKMKTVCQADPSGMRKARHHFPAHGIVGAIITGIVLLMVLVGIFYTPYDPNAMDASAKNLAPSLTHLFGTDHYGRDLLSRVMRGAGTTFFVGLMTLAIGGTVGTIIGALTGYFGGWFDELVMRINDGILAFPSILLALVFVGIFGSGERNVILALGILFVPSIARVVRGEMLKQKQLDYAANARLMGAGTFRIIFVHILPNLLSPLLVTLAIGFNNAVLAEAGLSYLSLGVQPPDASLGRMLAEAQSYLKLAPWCALFPGLTIVLAVLGVSLLQEAFTDTPVIRRRKIRADLSQQAQGNSALESEKAKEEDADTVLSVRNLKMGFYGHTEAEDREILHSVSFTLHAGETLGLVGESGSGKSMTALSIMQLLPSHAYTTGSIKLYRNLSEDDRQPEGRIAATELIHADDRLMQKLRGESAAMIFQEAMTALNPVAKIEKQMLAMLRQHGKRLTREEERERLLLALREVDLDEGEKILRSYPHELSGGMRQRVLIAMAMLHKPGILLADEPTTALDAETTKEVLALLRKLKEKHGMAILFISHDLKLVRELCDSVLVMNQGEIVERGSTAEVMEAPKEAYTRELMAAAKGTDYTKLLWRPENEEAVLLVQHLHAYYGRKRQFKGPAVYEKEVLKNVSVTVNRGDVYGILGRSGSGKTTFARCLLGWNDRNMIGRIERRAEIGMVFQDPYSSLNPAKTVGWLMEEPLRNQGIPREERREKVLEMLNGVGLSETYYSRRISELSGGQRQRIAIGIAMMAKPEILILDEPVSALDVTVQEQVLKLLAEFQNRWHLTYLLISHDESVIRRMVTKETRIDSERKL